MIKTRKDYVECLHLELQGSRRLNEKVLLLSGIPVLGGVVLKLFHILKNDYRNDFIRVLRRTEYHKNSKGWYHKMVALYSEWRLRRLSYINGITIPTGVFDKGLTLYHYGSIVVNSACRIGRNCCIMNNVNIGSNKGSAKAPQIGNNVYIGPGAVLFGDISVADNCYIGANAVVNKDILIPYSIVIGSPGKIIRQDVKTWWEYNGLQRDL